MKFMSGRMKFILFLSIVALVYTKADSQDPKGHLQPLGSHKPPEGFVKSVEDVPTPEYFFNNHILPGVPLLFKGAAKTIPAYSKWTDDYLSTKFGEINMDVEEGKKENRTLQTFNFKLQEFIRRYKNEDIYMVESIPRSMREDYTFLRSLRCGGFTSVLQDAVIWFSSGGTKSVLHYDGVDNINCLFSGSKDLLLINKKFMSQVHIDQPSGAFSSVDVDKVDMYKYPGFQNMSYYKINMEQGDCLFIPYKWIHQVRSHGSRNLAVNIWWAHLTKFNKTDCEEGPYKDKEIVPLGDFEFKPNEVTRQRFLENMDDKPIDVEQFVDILQKEAYIFDTEIKRTMLEERFAALDKDMDGIVTPEEIYAIPSDQVEQLLVPMVSEDDEERSEDVDGTSHENDLAGASYPSSEHTEL